MAEAAGEDKLPAMSEEGNEEKRNNTVHYVESIFQWSMPVSFIFLTYKGNKR